MLVDLDARHLRQVHDFARMKHDIGKRRRLLEIHFLEKHRHEERRHLVVGDSPIKIVSDELLKFFATERSAGALLVDDFSGGSVHALLLTVPPSRQIFFCTGCTGAPPSPSCCARSTTAPPARRRTSRRYSA